jgi:Uma2 family endonuclease
MPATLTERPPAPAAQCPPRKRWTRAEYERAEAAGVFDQQHIELVEGELIDKMPKKRPHAATAALLYGWLVRFFGDRRVNHETPVDVAPADNPTSQPEPDLFVSKTEYAESERFWSVTPQPGDLDLVVEISDTSLPFDLTTKASLYARAGIVEYWVVDVIGRRLIVHRDPEGGQYGSVQSYSEQESAAPLAVPGSILRIADLFPE